MTVRPATRLVAGALALAAGASCSGIVSGDEPVAIEFVAPPDTVLVDDTVVMNVRVLNRAGDSIPGAPVRLIALNPDTLAVDSALQAVIGRAPGPGRVVAWSGSLPSDPFRIIVVAP